jgi:hypothetical protein
MKLTVAFCSFANMPKNIAKMCYVFSQIYARVANICHFLFFVCVRACVRERVYVFSESSLAVVLR